MKKLKIKVEELGEELSKAQMDYLNDLQVEVSEGFDEAKKVVETFQSYLKSYSAAEAILKSAGVTNITLEAVRALESEDISVLLAKQTMIALLSRNITLARIQRILEAYGERMNVFYNENFDSRWIVGDNYSNQDEIFYGSNDVIADDPSHGTHVAGIIADSRYNGLGMKGVATNVKIMAIRVVPNGDERDKDVANGIRYAVDNGARIINMSFGKTHSPYKRVVDAAVKYAESKGVLLIHAAGNDNKDNDLVASYPMRIHRKESREMNNWLEIGASSFMKGLSLPAGFSNYGKKTVDLFSPGVDILSTTPDNTYDTYSGTSMAAPAAAGVAALLLSYDSSMDADSVKQLMIDTSRRYPKLKVNLPGTETPTLFSNLSTYGSILDALESVKVLK